MNIVTNDFTGTSAIGNIIDDIVTKKNEIVQENINLEEEDDTSEQEEEFLVEDENTLVEENTFEEDSTKNPILSRANSINDKSPINPLLKRAKAMKENNFESFADERSECLPKIFINGKSYFEDLFHTIMQAKKSIYICGLAISPELFLIRPVAKDINDRTRLMDILSIKAKENVLIKILVYKEIPYTLPLGSLHAKKTLNALHPNILVRRFPVNSFPFIAWTNHEKIVVVDNEIAYIGGIDLFWGRFDDEEMEIKEESNSENLYKWPGIDYSNDKLRDRVDLLNYMKEYLKRDSEQRMPWHDIAVRLEGPVVIDTYRHFIQRWYYAIDRKVSFPISFDDYLNSITTPEIYSKKGMMSCQLVRSASKWSVGNPTTEHSTLNAYCHLIDNSKHYIIIQNQFFISNTFQADEHTHTHKTQTTQNNKMINNIALHIRKRIEKAYTENKKFRVIILLPLIPAFAGNIEDTQSIKTILKYTYRTLIRHKGKSLIEKLFDFMGDKYTQYISFYSLRNHCDLKGVPKTEMCYIHSKIMLVDDLQVIIGSANINDRSLLGERDSEMCVVIKGAIGEDKFSSKMNGEDVIVSKFVFDFRVKLFKIFLGLNQSELEILNDPISDISYKFLMKRANRNTMKYREIFKPIPDDIYTSFDDFKYTHADNCSTCIELLREKYYKNKNEIKGIIVEFPLEFLKLENLSRGVFTKEKLVSVDSFI